MPISLISVASFSLSCAKFLQQDETNRILKAVEYELIQLRDRKVKAAVSLMNDAINCSNQSNLDYYIHSTLTLFVEAINSYTVDRELEELMKVATDDYEKLSTSKKERAMKHSWALVCYHTACIGAGVCSYYLYEYSNAFNYFDKALKQSSIIAKAIPRSFVSALKPLILYNDSDVFDCLIALEKHGLTNFADRTTNLYLLREVYDDYKDKMRIPWS